MRSPPRTECQKQIGGGQVAGNRDIDIIHSKIGFINRNVHIVDKNASSEEMFSLILKAFQSGAIYKI